MSRTRKISISLIAMLIAAVAIHELRKLPFETQQAAAAGSGMVLGLAMLGFACWAFPKFRMGVINSIGYPGFGPCSIAALLGGFEGHRVFTIIMAALGHG
jgi:hypothetical protein